MATLSGDDAQLYLLHDACTNSSEDLVAEIVSALPSNRKYIINLPDRKGLTPLFYAISTGKIKIAEYLIGVGARITHSIVFLAVRQANPYMLQFLAEHGANFAIQTDYSGWTALHDAVCLHNNDVIEFLVSHGVDVNSRDTNGTTPLCIALSRQNRVAVQKLLCLSADVNTPCDSQNGLLPVHVAAGNGHFDYLELLVDQTQNLNQLTAGKQTTLDLLFSYLCFCNSEIAIGNNCPMLPSEYPGSWLTGDTCRLIAGKGAVDVCCYNGHHISKHNLIAYFTKKILDKGGKLNKLRRAYRRDCCVNMIQMVFVLCRYPIEELFEKPLNASDDAEQETASSESVSYLKYITIHCLVDVLQHDIYTAEGLTRRVLSLWLMVYEVTIRLTLGPMGINLMNEGDFVNAIRQYTEQPMGTRRAFSSGITTLAGLIGLQGQPLSLKQYCTIAFFDYCTNAAKPLDSTSEQYTFSVLCDALNINYTLKDHMVGLD